jgi:osmoprotectant transport system ATP-binding protein
MFEFRSVRKSFAGREALAPLNLIIPPNRTTVLLGPSGCGKSTLVRLMLGLIAPDAGEVAFDGQLVTPANAVGLRQRMGYVIQDGGLFPHLTAAGNAALLSRFLGKPHDWISKRTTELADLTRFPHDGLARFPTQLSGGQRQRVGLIRALMLDPAVLLLDEPLGALDPLVRADLQDDLRRIFRDLGKTVVLVTHDLSEAAHFADEVVLMRAGRIVQRGSFRDLVRAPADDFVERFINAQRPPAIDGDGNWA